MDPWQARPADRGPRCRPSAARDRCSTCRPRRVSATIAGTRRPDDGVNGMTADRPLRIGLVAPPFLPVPPSGYAGTERIVAMLAQTLHRRGHQVTVFCSGDSELACEIVPVVPRAIWRTGERGWGSAWAEMAVARAWEESGRFDIIHSHVESAGFLMARYCATPVITTLHGRLDTGGVAALIDRFPEVPLIAISESQRRWNPSANWVARIHHG